MKIALFVLVQICFTFNLSGSEKEKFRHMQFQSRMIRISFLSKKKLTALSITILIFDVALGQAVLSRFLFDRRNLVRAEFCPFSFVRLLEAAVAIRTFSSSSVKRSKFGR